MYGPLKYAVVVLVLLCSSVSCSTISYYHQSISGHLGMISKRERIADIVNDPNRDEQLIQQLRLSQQLRSFASSELKLPDNDSYKSFVQLEHAYIVWNVFAAEEFSTQLVQWCYLVLGCVSYRGYFDEQDAINYAAQLTAKDLDVYVAGVPAYSTLGWFDDPLLSSMIDRGEIVTASYIFHELAHQQFYVNGDSAFNEAFATAVEEIGVERWLLKQNRKEELKKYKSWIQQKRIFSEFVMQSRNKLDDVYAENVDEVTKRIMKQDKIENMRIHYEDLMIQHKQLARYKKWMSGPLNNAQLGATALYRDQVPAFKRLYELCGQNFERFYHQVEMISKIKIEQREQGLKEIDFCL